MSTQPPPRAMTSRRKPSAHQNRKFHLQNTCHSTLKILTANVFGLYSKFGEFQHELHLSNADIAIITETKLTEEKMSLAESTITGFHAPLRLDRTGQGGGVAVWVKEDLAYEHLTSIDCGPHEIIWLSVKLRSTEKLVIGAVYRSGSLSGHDVSFLEYLNDQLDSIRTHGSHILLAGDFNVHSKSWLGSTKTTPAGEYTEELCSAHGLWQHVPCATRGSNLLDLVLSDLGDLVSVSLTNPIGSSDHLTLLVTIANEPFRERRNCRKFWRYDKADWGRLRKFLMDIQWQTILGNHPEEACEALTRTVLEGMEQFIPSKKLITRPSDPSWWTPECTAVVRAKQTAWKRWRGNPVDVNHNLYKTAALDSAACLSKARALELAHIRQRLTSGSLKCKQWWSCVKKAGGLGRQSSIPVIRDDQDTEYITCKEKAEGFGYFFAKKCSIDGGDFDESNIPPFPQRCSSTLCRVRFRPSTIKRHLRQLDPAKATGPDGIPARVLKECADALAHPLSTLFSLCFEQGVQPSPWKIANVVPVHKRKSRSEMRNYRPVSLLSILSKIMEKIVNRSIMNYLEKGQLLSAHQFGFRSGLGAADLLTVLNREWLTAINTGGAVRALAVDIAGAFDRVSHSGALHKLSSYGIRGSLHKWLTNYLSKRTLQAVVGGATSTSFPVTAGVPQGSILGPTLFLVYVNDAADVLPQGVTPATYADDTTLYTVLSTLGSAASQCKTFQTGVDNLATWGATWRIKFEPSKSQAMTITRHRNPWTIPPVSFHNIDVEEVSGLKLLGVTFDKHLFYGLHLRAIAMHAARRIGFLRKASKILDQHGRLSAYKGFVRPILEYCPLVWCGAATSHLSRLDRIQKRALSLIGPGVFLDSLALRRCVSALCLLHKLLNGPRLPTMDSLLPPLSAPLEDRRTRRQHQDSHTFQLSVTLPRRSNDTILKSFPYGTIAAWNALPPSVIGATPSASNLQAFKLRTYQHLTMKNWLWATDAL